MPDSEKTRGDLLVELEEVRSRIALLEVTQKDQLRADEALGSGEERYRTLVEGSPDIVWAFSDQRGTLYASSRIEPVLGYSPEELYRNPWLLSNSIHPGDQDAYGDAVDRFSAGGDLDVEYRVKDRWSRWHWFRDRSIGRRVNGDEIIIQGISTDITEHKRADEALRQSELLYRATVDAVDDVIHVVDRDLGFTLINETMREWCRRYGLPSDVIGRNLFDVFPFLGAKIRDEYEHVFETGHGLLTEEEHTMNGRATPTETRKIPIIEKGQVVRVVTVVRDISERRQAEEVQSVLFQISQAVGETADLEDLLRVIHRELGRLIDTTNFFVALYDEETGLYSFPYHVDLYDCDEIGAVPLRNSLTDYVRRTGTTLLVDPEEHRALMEQGEVELIGAQSKIWLGVPLKASGKTIGVVVVQCYDDAPPYTAEDRELLAFVSENIAVAIERKRAQTERQGLEVQIQQAQKLESLGVLAGGIAHDFNNLLTGILGNADLALMRIDESSPAHKRLKEIKTTAERAADLSRQMLAYSGRGSFLIEPIGLNDLVKEMGNLLEVSISKKVLIRYELDLELPNMVGDVTQIRQIIMNLITNASDAIGDVEGVISVSTGRMECDAALFSETYLDDRLDPGTYVWLEVADTGCGMDKETRKKIFDPFFTTKFTGRGLGLASVIGIVRGHKGTIRVDSKPAKGTRFRVFFPAGETPKRGSVEARVGEKQVPTEPGAVLLVDDEEAIRDVGRCILEDAGFTVVTAENGVEAISVFREHADEIACVLLDLTMPRMGGEEAFQELKRIRNDVRVIISSGYSGSEVTGRFEGAGIVGFVQKPYLVKDLLAEVRAAIDGSGGSPA
jgi:two-component system cell cycle sensor histidine kinase/response regulator CckA